MRFVKHEPGSPAYLIEEINGVAARFDGLFRYDGAMHVAALPTELLHVDSSAPFDDGWDFLDDPEGASAQEE